VVNDEAIDYDRLKAEFHKLHDGPKLSVKVMIWPGTEGSMLGGMSSRGNFLMARRWWGMCFGLGSWTGMGGW